MAISMASTTPDESKPTSQTKSFPHALVAVAIAVTYWLLDSSVHYLLFQEAEFELIPSENNELWMRSMVALLIVMAGMMLQIYTRRLMKTEAEKLNLQMHLNVVLQRELDAEHARMQEMKQTMAEVQDNLNNFLNRLQLYMLEIEEKQALPQSSLQQINQLIHDTAKRLQSTGEAKFH